ncbi:MAG: transposase [Gemmatimonadetes bacterium]|nr:transposase [Gemmatimonadota bacterium]
MLPSRAAHASASAVGYIHARHWPGTVEFAIQKGHRYATSIVDPVTTKVLWVGRGRGREDIRPFFTLLGPEGCAQLEAAVMDMSEAYELETRTHCPHAVIVYDLFHLVAKYGREVVDRVRVDETNRLARAGRPRDRRTVAMCSGHQRDALAAAAQSRERHRPAGPRAPARRIGRQPPSLGRLRIEGRAQATVALSLPGRGAARMA